MFWGFGFLQKRTQVTSFIHAESDRVILNSSVALHVAGSSSTQQSTVDHTHQPDIRTESANPLNPVIFSNTAKLAVDSGCFDHCCRLEFAAQFELKEARFLNASAANTIKLNHHGTRVVEGWTRDVNGTEIPLKIKFNVFDVKSPLLSTSKLRKHGYSVLLDQQQTIQKNGTTIALTDQNGLPTLELRLTSRAVEVCALVEEIGEEQLQCTCLTSAATSRLTMAFQLCRWTMRSCMTQGDKDAEVTFLTMVDNSSGQMFATAVQKKGHDKFVERFLFKSPESFGVTREMVLQTDRQRNGTDQCG